MTEQVVRESDNNQSLPMDILKKQTFQPYEIPIAQELTEGILIEDLHFVSK